VDIGGTYVSAFASSSSADEAYQPPMVPLVTSARASPVLLEVSDGELSGSPDVDDMRSGGRARTQSSVSEALDPHSNSASHARLATSLASPCAVSVESDCSGRGTATSSPAAACVTEPSTPVSAPVASVVSAAGDAGAVAATRADAAVAASPAPSHATDAVKPVAVPAAVARAVPVRTAVRRAANPPSFSDDRF
jgi:hypothetical protein